MGQPASGKHPKSASQAGGAARPRITALGGKSQSVKPLVLRKLSFKEEKELEALPLKIEKLEAQQEEIFILLADINFYQRDPHEIERVNARLEAIAQELLRGLSALGVFRSI